MSVSTRSVCPRPVVRLGVVIVAALLATAACSSSSKSKSATSSSSAALSTSAPATASATLTAETAPIAQAWSRFFAGTTSAADKQALLQNGSAFAAAIAAQANSPMAKGTTATVSKVTLVSADKAQVTYTISLGGIPVLPDQTGTAVRIDGSWKVGSASFCQLLALQGTAPPACGAASAPASS
jgi:hypothetical protein